MQSSNQAIKQSGNSATTNFDDRLNVEIQKLKETVSIFESYLADQQALLIKNQNMGYYWPWVSKD